MAAPPAPLDAPFDRLHALPRSLWLPALVSAVGGAGQRLDDSRRWHAALAAGTLPPLTADFGAADACGALRDDVARLGLPALCGGAPALADQVLRTLLWHFDRLIDLQPRCTRAEAIAQISAEFSAAWQQQRGDWDAVQRLLHGLGDLGHLRWDQLRGRLTRREWHEAQRISDKLQALPELVALIRRLGRRQPGAAPPVAAPQAAERAQPPVTGVRVVQTLLPDAPGELRGIRHSDRIAQMLGSEAAMLLHPVLHKLWRARRAEARLLTYDSQAVLRDLRADPHAPPRHAAPPAPPQPRERGPIIVCLDTSGSMRGAPETLAKAVALQALRTAHAERRGCRLIAFGGADEIIERELGLDADGLDALLALIGQSFDGGTDLQLPLDRALACVQRADWSSADLLLVSDGEFGCTPATLARLDDARARCGLRVQGVLVGDRETLGLLEVCDDIHWLRDWRAHGDGPRPPGGFSPVHSRSLTALYFPGALSARAARHVRR